MHLVKYTWMNGNKPKPWKRKRIKPKNVKWFAANDKPQLGALSKEVNEGLHNGGSAGPGRVSKT